MINTYIWDLDGTLLDSYRSIVSSLAEVSGEAFDDIMKAVKLGALSELS